MPKADKFNPHDYDSLGIGNLPDVNTNATLDANATDGNGHILNGSGNPASGWEIQNNGPFQLATDVHYRQGDAGQQVADPAHNVPPDSGAHPHGATSFDFSFSTAHTGNMTIQDFLANGGEFIWKLDLDPTQHNDPLVLHAVYDPVHNTGG
jgi:hypothetical protein